MKTIYVLKYLHFFLFIFLSGLASSQNSTTAKTDSMLIAIDIYKQQSLPILQIETLNKFAGSILNNHPDSSLVFILEAEVLSKANNYLKGAIDAQLLKADVYEQIGKISETKDIFLDLLSDNNSYTLNDSLYAIVNLEYGNFLNFIKEKKQARTHLNIAEEYFTTAQQNDKLVDTYIALSSANTNIDSSISLLNKALDLAKKNKDKGDLATIYSNLAIEYYNGKQEVDLAISMWEQALETFIELRLKKKEAYIHYILSIVNSTLGKQDLALVHATKRLELCKEINDQKGIVESFGSISNILTELERYDESNNYLFKSVDLALAIDLENETASIYNSIARNYYELGNKKEAIVYFDKSLEMSKKHDRFVAEINTYLMLSQIHTEANEYNLADQYLRKGIAIADSRNSPRHRNMLVAALVENLLEWHQKKPEESTQKINFVEIESMLQKTLKIARASKAYEFLKSTYEGIAELEKIRGNYYQVSLAQQEIIALKDSVYQKEKTDASIKYAEELNTAEKEKEIIVLENENIKLNTKAQIQKNRLLSAIVILSILFFAFYSYSKNKNRLANIKERESIRSKISNDLHDDVGSILTGISMQTELLETRINPDNLKSFRHITAMSRKAMEHMRDTVWAIDAQKDSSKDLADRMLDFSNELLMDSKIKLKFDNQLADTIVLKPDVRQALYLIFKEALTNALKHSNTNTVTVSLKENSNAIAMHIKDFGTTHIEEFKTSGLGIQSMKQRALKLNGKFDAFYDKGFQVKVEIPIL